jgi:SAM-dependent methyltransferase
MITRDFKPSLFHPYYFIRKGLLTKIDQYKGYLTGRLLDFGCGSKPYRSLITVEEYVGVDYENPGHPHDNEQIDIFYNGKNIPVPDNHFDSALSSEVFEHVFNLEEALEELHRVLKPGAPLLITCPFVWKEHEVPHDFARYTHFSLQHLLEKHGFTAEVLDKAGNFIEVLYQLRVLYFYDAWYPKFKRIPGGAAVSTFFFIFIPNVVGNVLSKLLPEKKQMYLNNVVVARKK